MISSLLSKGVQTPLKSAWKNKAGDFSTIYLWPQHHEESLESKKYTVIYMIVGNPGVPEYYTDFLSHLYELLNRKVEIILTGHLGQSVDMAWSPRNHKIFTLQDQVDHKVEIIDHLVEQYPPDTDFFVIGHSLGAWLSEQVIKNRPSINIKQVFSLFPALCKLRDTPNGRWMSKYVFPKQYRKALTTLISGFNLLPSCLLTYLISISANLPGKYAQITIDELFESTVAANGFAMADDEMEVIYDLDIPFYRENVEKFTFYYGTTDEWVPMDCVYEMKDNVPGAKVYICEEKIPHAYVLDHSEDLALKVKGWIQPLL